MNCDSDKKRFWSKVNKTDGCWLWTASVDRKGYGYFWSSHHKKICRAPRISWEIANAPIPTGLWVLHHCDNPRCVNPSHLFLGTPLDNQRDCQAKARDRKASGESAGSAKLTWVSVMIIRDLYANGVISQRALALQFGVSQGTIGPVIREETWRAAIQAVNGVPDGR